MEQGLTVHFSFPTGALFSDLKVNMRLREFRPEARDEGEMEINCSP